MVHLANNMQKYLGILFQAAEEYEKNLLGNEFLFIGRDNATGEVTSFETWFAERHFLHLTGIKPAHGINSERFFSLCKMKRLRKNDIIALPTGQSALKLDIILPFMDLTKVSKMMGDFGSSGNYIYTEKLSGTTWGCMGFVLDEETHLFAANTLLKEDIRNLAKKTKQIVAIYQKRIGDTLYPDTPITCAKQLRGKTLVWPEEIARKIQTVT